MKIYIILLRTEPNYQLLKRLISDYPVLKNGFTVKEILKLPSLSFNDKKSLKKLFGGDYSEILTPIVNFKYQNRKWKVEEIDVQRGFHQSSTKVLNHILEEGKYSIGSPVSTIDMEFLAFLMKKENEVYEKELRELEVKGERLPITQELLEFISGSLKERLGEVDNFDYVFVRTFREALRDYEEILIRREFE